MRSLKKTLKGMGLSRAGLVSSWFRLNCAFPFRYLTAWLFRPALISCWLRNKLAGRTVLSFPERPAEVGYEIAKLSMVLGFKLRAVAEKPHVGLTWQDVTVRGFTLPNSAPYFLNGRCTDIGKDRVEDIFAEVFGYPLRVDPTVHRGPCVRKSTLNGKHDGAVVQCPIEKPEPNNVYQRLIDNQVNEHQVLDLRTPVYRGEIPVIYKKLRPISTRFGNDNDQVTIARPEEIYSADEREFIRRFCRAFDLDYGGLDIMRDKVDGRIYIVDVNYTPFGPPVELSVADRATALGRLAVLFQKTYIDGLPALMSEETSEVEQRV